MSSLPRVVIKRRASRPFFARHPWVFVTSIERVEGDPQRGDEVEVVSFEGQFIGQGLFNPKSAIRVRLYRWDKGSIDAEFLSDRIHSAANFRANGLGLRGPNVGARLIFSEADGLSGLTVDRFDRWLVAQFTGAGLHVRADAIVAALSKLPDVDGVVVRGEASIAEAEGLHIQDHVAWGSIPSEGAKVIEHGIAYKVDLTSGQKTGFYLDQRDNRRVVGRLATGRRVLDLYCYTGGFGLNAVHQGAVSSLGIDSSAGAIKLARENAELNGLPQATFEEADVSDTVARLREDNQKFGLVICDPPKFARHPKGLEKAVKAYLGVNRSVIELVEPDGILVTCSCSGLVERALFADILGRVAEHSGRSIQILDQRGQAADHPVSASCLESDYLKCFICRVI
jgi:23S rRNA (cytosine1962-C5)-methyltransferase